MYGSPAWDRTTDTLINSQVQLPLCYWGIKLGGTKETRTLKAAFTTRRISNPLQYHYGTVPETNVAII